jgi:tryptophanyl-tRNA synthetase
MNNNIFNPWEVKGDIDYNKLLKEFGIKPIEESSLLEEFKKNILFRRKKIFAHRDFNIILESIKNKKPFCMMTGLMPTGKFHIGHMILAKQMIFYQKLGAKIYIAVADIEAYNARGQSIIESKKKAIEEYILNYTALGLDLNKCDLYFQSNRSKNEKKTNAYYRLQNLFARHITFNEFKSVYGEISPGKMMSALLQASDMLHPQLKEFEGNIPIIIPVGIDQDPHLRLARDISQRIKEYKFKQIASTYHVFVPGLSGGKMSSSDETSYIALTDDEKTVKKKVNRYAFSGGKDTLEEHRKYGGNPDIDISYQWLTFIEEDDEKLKEIYDNYKSGKLLSGELKLILIEKLNNFLKEHQKKREINKEKVNKMFQ